MEKTDRPGFICPACGGTRFGSSGLDGPQAQRLVHCHALGCAWSGPHAEYVFPVHLRAAALVQRGFTESDAEKTEAFARRLFFGDRETPAVSLIPEEVLNGRED